MWILAHLLASNPPQPPETAMVTTSKSRHRHEHPLANSSASASIRRAHKTCHRNAANTAAAMHRSTAYAIRTLLTRAASKAPSRRTGLRGAAVTSPTAPTNTPARAATRTCSIGRSNRHRAVLLRLINRTQNGYPPHPAADNAVQPRYHRKTKTATSDHQNLPRSGSVLRTNGKIAAFTGADP